MITSVQIDIYNIHSHVNLKKSLKGFHCGDFNAWNSLLDKGKLRDFY